MNGAIIFYTILYSLSFIILGEITLCGISAGHIKKDHIKTFYIVGLIPCLNTVVVLIAIYIAIKNLKEK